MAVRVHHEPGPDDRPLTLDLLMYLCRTGSMPAEALPAPARAQLLRELHRRGWTDTEIATHSRMTTYTTARIREALHLPSNRPTEGTTAA